MCLKPKYGLCRETDKRHPKTHSLQLSLTLEKRLRKFYEPYNQKLYTLIGRDLGWEHQVVESAHRGEVGG
jgi:hypothetical protein